MSEYDRSKLLLLKSKIKRSTPPTGYGATSGRLPTPPEMRSAPVRSTAPEVRYQGGYIGTQPGRPAAPIWQATSTPQYVQAPRGAQVFPRSAPQVLQKQQTGLSGLPAEQGVDEARNECRDCRRKFNDQAFMKHQKVCRKVFVQKRKVFDSAKVRIQAIVEEANKTGGAPSSLLAQASRSKRPGPHSERPGNISATIRLGGINVKNQTGWREKSAQFRAAIGSVRKENSSHGYQDNYPGAFSAQSSNKFKCPHCPRTFSEEKSCNIHVSLCLKHFNGTRLQRGTGTLSHSTTRKVDSTSLRLGGTPTRVSQPRGLPSQGLAATVRRR